MSGAASIGLGVVAYTLFGLAMALMKLGAPALARPRAIAGDPALRRLFGWWLLGALTNLAFVAVQTAAIHLGSASTIGALNGVGLAVLAVLSHVLLDERVGRAEVTGIALIVAGTAAMAIAAGPPAPDLPPGARRMLAIAGGGASVLAVLVAASAFRRGGPAAGPVLGGAAGALGGLAILCQKLFAAGFAAAPPGAGARTLLVDPAFLGFLLVSNASFVVLQMAYQRGDAVRVVPVFSAAVIATPVVGGIAAFAEPFGPGQGLALLVLAAGVASLTSLTSLTGRAARCQPAPAE